jgi:isocitrate dehydrogenase kinase/phosphatase
VFKVIRDRFPYPKNITRDEVRQRYQMAMRHNTAGRLVDAQEFRMLRLDRDRFDPALLDELLAETAAVTRLDGDSVVIGHTYVERRLRPLDLYLQEATPQAAAAAVRDYGCALRDLAATNVFPGDLLTKNFGVSRTGRVLFYDYDEICLLTDCSFRDIPKAHTPEDELAAEPWFAVGPADVFPEEFSPFLGFGDELMAAFREVHADLLGAAWWRGMQARLRAGELLEVLPY